MTQDIIDLAVQASKEWMKEYPTPEETANPVPKRYLEIFAKLVAAKEREACAKLVEPDEDHRLYPDVYLGEAEGVVLLDNKAAETRARAQSERGEA